MTGAGAFAGPQPSLQRSSTWGATASCSRISAPRQLVVQRASPFPKRPSDGDSELSREVSVESPPTLHEVQATDTIDWDAMTGPMAGGSLLSFMDDVQSASFSADPALSRPAKPLPSILISDNEASRVLVPRRRGDDEVAESLLDDMCSPCTLMSARQRAQAANGLLDMIQDGRIAAESLLRRGAMAIVIPLMGQPVDGINPQAAGFLRWRAAELAAELMSSTRTTAVAEHLAMLSLGGTPGALYLASVAAGTIVQCSREMQQVSDTRTLISGTRAAERPPQVLGSPLFAGPTIEAAARVLLAVLDAAPSHALEVLSDESFQEVLLDNISEGSPQAGACARLIAGTAAFDGLPEQHTRTAFQRAMAVMEVAASSAKTWDKVSSPTTANVAGAARLLADLLHHPHVSTNSVVSLRDAFAARAGPDSALALLRAMPPRTPASAASELLRLLSVAHNWHVLRHGPLAHARDEPHLHEELSVFLAARGHGDVPVMLPEGLRGGATPSGLDDGSGVMGPAVWIPHDARRASLLAAVETLQPHSQHCSATRLAAARLLWGAAAASADVRRELATAPGVLEALKAVAGLDLRRIHSEGSPEDMRVAVRLMASTFLLARELAADSEIFAALAAQSAVLPLMVSVLQTGDAPAMEGLPQVQAAACLAMRAIARYPDAQLYVVAAGAIPALMRLVRDQVAGGAAAHASVVLAELGTDHGVIRRQLGRAGAVLPIVELLRTGSVYEQAHAAAALEAMASQPDMLLDMEQAGVTPVLVQILESEQAAPSASTEKQTMGAYVAEMEQRGPDMLLQWCAEWIDSLTWAPVATNGANLADLGDHRWQISDLTERVDVEGFRWRNLRAFQGVEDASVWSRGAGVTMGSDGEELSCSAEEWGLAQWCKIKCAWLVAKLADDARLRIKIGRMGTVPPLIKLLSENADAAAEDESEHPTLAAAAQAAASAALMSIGRNNRQNRVDMAQELAWYIWAGKRARLNGLRP